MKKRTAATPAPQQSALPAPLPDDRLAEALLWADPDVRRALALVRVETELALAALSDSALLQLPRVGKTTVRKVHRLRQGLGLIASGDRTSQQLRLWLPVDLNPEQHQRLTALAQSEGVSPRDWLLRTLQDLLEHGRR